MLQGLWLMLRRTKWSIDMFSVFLMKCFTWLVTEISLPVISLPKPDIDVISLELNEENQGSARVINEHESQGAVDTTLLEALQEFLERNTYSLNGSETERLLELLFNYKHVFSISDEDLGTTHMVQHRIETGNALPM